MNKRYLSILLFILMITLSGCASADKKSVTAKLPPIGAKVYQKNTILFQKNDVLFKKDVSKAKVQNVTGNSNKYVSKNGINNIVDPIKKQPVVQTTFKQGDKGSRVKDIQVKLNKFGYKLNLDGNFGKVTYNAVTDFQMRNKLPRDGIVRAATINKMNLKPTTSTIYKKTVITKFSAIIYNNDLEKYVIVKTFQALHLILYGLIYHDKK